MMTEQEQCIAIAEFYGWKHRLATQTNPVVRNGMRLPNSFAEMGIEAFWHDKVDGVYGFPPNYFRDLNAVHDVVLKLSDWQCEQYARILATFPAANYTSYMFGPRALVAFVKATPAQHCEALLRAIGKWKE